MKKYELFLKWWLKTVLMSIGIVLCNMMGVWETIWIEDTSKLSYVILAFFLFFSLKAGYWSFKLDGCGDEHEKATKFVEYAWLWSSKFQMIGMIGTVVGFIMVLGGNMSEMDPQNIEQFKMFVKNMSFGISTALYTTLVGLVCSLLLRIQLYPIQSRIEDYENA